MIIGLFGISPVFSACSCINDEQTECDEINEDAGGQHKCFVDCQCSKGRFCKKENQKIVGTCHDEKEENGKK